MKNKESVTGIVAEFNPFHNGHKYLLDQADGVKIVAMSGNFVQRGEPALVDKWTRAQMALENGADIVVELPFLVAVQSADYFANGALTILARLGVDNLTFGTEEVIDYQALGEIFVEKEAEMQLFLQNQPNSLSYPQKTQAMWEQFTGIQFSGDTPNHILGLAYTKAAAKHQITLNPIQRQGSGYHSTDKESAFASATSLRVHRRDLSFVEKFTPSAGLLQTSPQVTWQNYFELLKYQIITHQALTDVYQVNQELANRIKKAIKQVKTVDQLVDKVATKRYTKSRVRRILTYILVNASEMALPESIHILGFTKKGRVHLASVKQTAETVSRIGAQAWDEISQQADIVYQMGNAKISEQNWGRVPVQTEE
jgi:predicted nucleotidyltransferase